MKRSHETVIRDALHRLWWATAQRGWNLTQLAKAGNIDRSVLTRWRDGEVEPRLSSLSSLANAVGLTLDDLLLPDTLG